MRRLAAIALAAGLAAAVLAPQAAAAPATITGTPLNTFDMASYNHGGGELANLVVTGGTHNVTSAAQGPDGRSLFASDTISGGSAAVKGTQYLPLGSYAFICTIHPSTMSANLNVNTGTPLARPDVELKIKSRSIDQVVRKEEVKLRVTITGGSSEQARGNLYLGKKKISDVFAAVSSVTLRVPLNSKGINALEGRSKAKIKADATIDFGEPAATKGKLK